jgi:hypothetical protein
MTRLALATPWLRQIQGTLTSLNAEPRVFVVSTAIKPPSNGEPHRHECWKVSPRPLATRQGTRLSLALLRLGLGAEIPRDVELYEFAPLVLDQIPKLRTYRFVVSRDELVIVVPRDRSVALVLDR